MSGRQRSGTYSSLCEPETDFVPIVRSNSISGLSFLDEVDLENALLKTASSMEAPSTVRSSRETIEGGQNPLYATFQMNMSNEILSRLESVPTIDSEDGQLHIMEEILMNCSSFIDMKIFNKLNVPFLTPNSLYSEIVADSISYQLMKGNHTMRDRLLAIANSLSSHSLFDPIFCQLSILFVCNYLSSTLENPALIDDSVEMHNLLLFCMNSVFKGSNRLFMFDVNNHQCKFHNLYYTLRSSLLHCCESYTAIEQSEKDFHSKDSEETVIVASGSLQSTQVDSNDENMVQDHRLLIRVFLSDLLTIVGKYMVYFENANELIPTVHEIDEKCRFLDLKKMENPSSIVFLYTILILSTIRSEESLILYLKKIRQFHDITLNFDLSVRLQSVLQNLSTSGGPLFPTVDVRHEAQHTINTLYPSGRVPRFLVHVLFACLHPYYVHLWFLRLLSSFVSSSWKSFSSLWVLTVSLFATILQSWIRYWIDVWSIVREEILQFIGYSEHSKKDKNS